MDVSSRQIVALAAPVVVTYLTWSAVTGTTTSAALPDQGSSISTVAASKRPVVPKLTRDAFSQEGYAVSGEGPMVARGQSGTANVVHLNGTVVAGKWRMAIIDGTRVFEGQAFRGFVVRTVARDSVTLVNAEGKTLALPLEITAPPPLADLQTTKPAEADAMKKEMAERTPLTGHEREAKTALKSPARADKPTTLHPVQGNQEILK